MAKVPIVSLVGKLSTITARVRKLVEGPARG